MIHRKVFQIIVSLMLAAMAGSLHAQTIRDIEIAEDASYTDHISLKQDSRDMDVMAKFVFDEQNNALTVSLISYRNLFVFQSDVRYNQVVKRNKFKPERFPYVIETDNEFKYYLTKNLRKQIVGSKKKYVFKRWMEYEGLQPQPTDYKMVNDYIEQKFDILNKDTLVTVTLRDIFVMERSSSKKKQFDFLYFTDLNRKYRIRIHRNPCLGKDEEIEAAKVLAEDVRTNYETLRQKYDSMETLNHEALQLLNEMREILLEQFPRKEQMSACPIINQYRDSYNAYVDSIYGLEEYQSAYEKQRAKLAIEAEEILSVVRIVDSNTALWLVSTDAVEKADLIKQSQLLLDDINNHLKGDVVMDQRQAAAVSMFRKAESYFKTTCLQSNKKK